MVSLDDIRLSLDTLARRSLVAVFVGGTSGIGEATLKALCSRGNHRVYIVGRNKSAATSIITSCRDSNPNCQVEFLQQDVSLLRDIDRLCEALSQRESAIDLLFMSQGYLSVRGRNGR